MMLLSIVNSFTQPFMYLYSLTQTGRQKKVFFSESFFYFGVHFQFLEFFFPLPILSQWFITARTAWKHQWWKHHLLFSDIFREHKNGVLAWNGLIRYLFFLTSIKFFTSRTISISFRNLIYSNTFLMEPNNFAIFVVTLIYVIFILPHLTKTPNIFCFSMEYFYFQWNVLTKF